MTAMATTTVMPFPTSTPSPARGRARAGAGLSPAARRCADAGLGVSQDRRRRVAPACSKASSAARRSAGTAFWPPSRSCELDARGTAGDRDHARGQTDRIRRATIRWTSCAAAWQAIRAVHSAGAAAVHRRGGRLRGYDVVRYIENLPNAPPDDRGLPDLSFAFYDRMVVFDNVSKTHVVVAHGPAGQDHGDVARRPTTTPAAGSMSSSTQLSAPTPTCRRPTSTPRGDADDRLSIELHAGRVRSGRRQVRRVHPRRRHFSGRHQPAAASCDLHCDPFEIYRTLRVVNPSPFMFYPAHARA